jgi:D-alanyl-D-alanine carboxypeptidase
VRINRQGELDAGGRHQIVEEVQVALLALLAAARAEKHELRIESAFRSYADQAHLFATMKEAGRAARPGHSEHQLGTVADLRLPTSAAIDWLAAHAHDFGFALSYPQKKQKLTGYRPEPWHVRYVGRELAEELYSKKLILEEYFRAQPDAGESGGCSDCPLPASQAACGEATAEGSCKGSLLTWCYDGVLVTVDCATADQQCGPVTGSAEHDCLDVEPGGNKRPLRAPPAPAGSAQ